MIKEICISSIRTVALPKALEWAPEVSQHNTKLQVTIILGGLQDI